MQPQNRLRMFSGVSLSAALALSLIGANISPAQQPDESDSQVRRGFAINPVPLNLDGT